MTKCIAFLRAINVGGRVVKMDQLRAIVEPLGVTNVETFIASGNVIFDTSARKLAPLERKIEAALHDALGYDVETFIRTAAELQQIVEYRPFAEAELAAHTLYVGFLAARIAATAEKNLLALANEADSFHLHGRELYWLRRGKISDSPITNAKLERTLGTRTTMRNITTVRKLAAKYE